MKLLSALFDAALLPIAIASTLIVPPFVRGMGDCSNPDSFTRAQIEKIEDDLAR